MFSLRSIALRYIKSGWFFINLLASFPTSLVAYYVYGGVTVLDEGIHDRNLRLLFMLNLLKMFRLIGIKGRIRRLVDASTFVSGLWTKLSIETFKFIEFAFLIILITHWFGCIWGFVAFVEVGTFNEDEMLSTPNWMGNWQKSNNITGGLSTLGYSNARGRYWLVSYFSFPCLRLLVSKVLRWWLTFASMS